MVSKRTGDMLWFPTSLMTRVRDLVDMPELRLRLHAGAELLDRPVSRIFVTELPDPGRYASASELVVSGLLWWQSPGDAEPFVAALARAGCAALAASGADTNGIPTDVVQACLRHRIPLVEVPADLSFAVLTERMVLALATERSTPAGARQRLVATAAENPPLRALLRHGASELGTDCWVLSATGRVVASSGSELAHPQQLAALFVSGGGRQRVTGEYSIIPATERASVPWMLLIAGEIGDDRAELVAELIDLIALARSRLDEVREVTDRVAAPAIRALAGKSASPSELTAALAATGLATDAHVWALLVRIGAADTSVGVELLADLVARGQSRTFIGAEGDEVYALVEADEPWQADWCARAADALCTVEPLLDANRILLAVGGPAPLSGLYAAGEEARHAADVAARRPGRTEVVSGREIGVHRLLLARAPDELRHSIRERLLGPLLGYDAAHHSDLVHTLRVFLDCSGSPAAAAKALHVHVNTLRYRIWRIGEILNLDPTIFANQVDLYLALSIEA